MLWAMPATAPQPVHWHLICSAATHRDERRLEETHYGAAQSFGFDVTDPRQING